VGWKRFRSSTLILSIFIQNILMTFLKIDWAPNEIFLKLGPLAIHWYSVMFIIAFTLGYYIIKKIYINDNKSIELVEPLFIYTVLGTLIGARLGEVFFYNWEYFQNNLIMLVKEFTIKLILTELFPLILLIKIDSISFIKNFFLLKMINTSDKIKNSLLTNFFLLINVFNSSSAIKSKSISIIINF